MALKDALLPEFDHEMGATRRVLERIPEADLRWKPHEKSYSLGQLSAHLANLPTWVDLTCDLSVFDLASLGEDARPKEPATTREVVARFDENVSKARRKLSEQTDSALMSMWTLQQQGQEFFTMPKIAVLRSFVMNHSIHHRGQLTVYLRLRNVPLPSIYGPTADEQ
jgi:uncharacterized damage-inducible protein DinB